jgi:ElaA protein
VIRRALGSELSASDLYAALELRAAVFVVEQACAYLDPDGRDLEATTEHLWIDGPAGDMAAYLRVLLEPDGTHRIGRVVTAIGRRDERLASRLLEAALEGVEGAVVLSAQSNHTSLYERHGFRPDGPEFLDDGIPHTPMRRPPDGSQRGP